MGRHASDELLQAKKRAFLDAFIETGTITQAAKAVDVARCTHYEWIRTDEQYLKDFEASQVLAAHTLEEEARRRAIRGVREPVFQGGQKVGHIKRYSDTLLIFLLKGNNPAKFKDRHEVTGRNDGPLQVSQQVDLSVLTIEEKRELARLADKLAGDAAADQEGSG